MRTYMCIIGKLTVRFNYATRYYLIIGLDSYARDGLIPTPKLTGAHAGSKKIRTLRMLIYPEISGRSLTLKVCRAALSEEH